MEIYLNKKFDSNLDWFQVGKFNSHYFISNRLKFALEANNISGILINESTMINL